MNRTEGLSTAEQVTQYKLARTSHQQPHKHVPSVSAPHHAQGLSLILIRRSVRQPTHAGSWYTSNGTPALPSSLSNLAQSNPADLCQLQGDELRRELETNLAKVKPLPELDYHPPISDAKAIIAP